LGRRSIHHFKVVRHSDITVGLFVALVLSACKTGPAPTSVVGQASVDGQPPLTQVGPGMFELGRVKFDKNAKTVSFPAVINQTSGVIEYFLVTTEGKTHESFLRTDVRPHQIHLALLLLGATGTTNSFPENPAMPLPGDAVSIEIAWKRKGKRTTRRAEELVFDTKTQSAMSRGSWVFNGSMVIDGTFVAEEQGSIISIIEDPYALVNNPRPGRERDEIWEVLSKQVPPQETEVEVKMCLEDAVGPHAR
jgi:hypothetical protein